MFFRLRPQAGVILIEVGMPLLHGFVIGFLNL
jgi:hypothetical protein